MQLSDIFLGLGEENFQQLLRSISMGKLRTYQLFDRLKTRLHFHKLSSENLRKASPRLFARMNDKDEDYATDIAQAILVSHLEMIKAVLDHLGVPHEDGFFQKDADVSGFLKEGWLPEVWAKYQAVYSPAALLFYINHLAWEVTKSETVFTGDSPK